MSHYTEQKVVAKNTIFLYLRMILVMLVSFFTSRVVLDKLGVEDFGIYNIVGSVVLSFTFVSNSLMASTQRFMSYSIGQNEEKNCSRIFSMSINIHFVLLVVLLLIFETIGLWFFDEVIKIPSERHDAAIVTYHISVATFCINLLRIPYNSLIIANEKMSIYAVFSIVDVALKLVIVYLLTMTSADKLIFYAILICVVTFIVNSCYVIYCKIMLKDDCHYYFKWEGTLFKDILSFSGWNLVGGLIGAGAHEGPNYLINIFLGVRVNAAMGIAKQVSGAVYNFSANFQTAFNPQITKSYASGEKGYFFDLLFRTSKLSFYLIYVIAVPFILCCHDLLDIWLVEVPQYAEIFCICILISQSIAAMSSPFWMAAHAIGNIRNYQLCVSFLSLVTLPIAWILLKLEFEAYTIIIGQAIVNLIVLVYRLYYLYSKVDFPQSRFYREVVLRLLILLPLITIPELWFVSKLFTGWINIIVTSVVSTILISIIFFFVAFNRHERKEIINLILTKVHNFSNK